MSNIAPLQDFRFSLKGLLAVLLLWATAEGVGATGAGNRALPRVFVAVPVASTPSSDMISVGPLSLSDNDGTADVEPQETQGSEFVLRLTDTGGTSHAVPLPLMGTPQQLVRAGNRLVVMGREGGGLVTTVLVDVRRAAVVDRFTGFHPILSPDHAWIAFVRFHPLGGGPRNPEDQPRLYQVAASASENRRDVPPAWATERAGEGPWDLWPAGLDRPGPQAARACRRHANGAVAAPTDRVGRASGPCLARQVGGWAIVLP